MNEKFEHLIERYARVGADTLDYQFTIDDPTTYTRPWTAALPMMNLRRVNPALPCDPPVLDSLMAGT